MILRPWLLLSTALLSACSAAPDRRAATPAQSTMPGLQPERADPAARQAYFGDLHLHTSYSYDAWANAPSRLTPDDAYRFARGEPVSFMGRLVRRSEPLDFMAVTDHSEYMGVLNQLDDPANPLSSAASTAEIRAAPQKGFQAYYYHMHKDRPLPPGMNEAGAMRDSWARAVTAANANYQPGRFTTFIGYEWTSMPDGDVNLHRNVIFNGDHAPQPFTSVDSNRPEDLWAYLERVRAPGLEAIAIPHNSNASGGLMFDWVDSNRRPISEAYAQRRALNEPLAEIYQTKGESEIHPDISTNDEYANFEKWDTFLTAPRKSEPRGSYLRDALGRGLVIKQRVGANPYKYGFVGGSDIHSGLSGTAENAFNGRDWFDPEVTPPDRKAVQQAFAMRPARDTMAETVHKDKFESQVRRGSAGLTGVWAERNTRGSIFAALRRRESFATSGTRIKLRFFGGWTYPAALLRQAGWVGTAYRIGVPMGSDLPAVARVTGAPRFLLWALKDPNSGNLDRIQIIKVWLEGGSYREKLFDVAWSGARRLDPRTGKLPDVGNTVDLATATYTNSIGSAELKAIWRDPEFKPGVPTVYYARVLEIPTPRWTTYLAVKHNLPLPSQGPATLQERAWSSPIWYTPNLSRATRPTSQHGPNTNFTGSDKS